MHRRPHLIVVGPGDFGQKAIYHFLSAKAARGGALSVVVLRRDQHLYEEARPLVKEWSHFSSLKAALTEAGSSVRVYFDDQLGLLLRQVVDQRVTGAFLVCGYITTLPKDHLRAASFLVHICERVLIEKPLSNVEEDLDHFTSLESARGSAGCEQLWVAEHYLCRPASLRAAQEAKAGGELASFLERHGGCHLTYEFNFAEQGSRENPMNRLGAFRDGAALDVAVSHGLGPVINLLSGRMGAMGLGVSLEGLAQVVPSLRVFKAVDEGGHRAVPVWAETAVELGWDFESRAPNWGSRSIVLRSGKGLSRNDRWWRVYCEHSSERACKVRESYGGPRSVSYWEQLTGSKKFLYGCSLGSDGTTLVDWNASTVELMEAPRRVTRRNEFGGYRSDRSYRDDPEAHNAQAAMIEALIADTSLDPAPFIPIDEAIKVTRIALESQQRALRLAQDTYVWGRHHTLERMIRDCATAPSARSNHVSRVNSRIQTLELPEGGGRTEVARGLACKRGVDTRMVTIPRMARSCSSDNDELAFRELLGQLGDALGHAVAPVIDVVDKFEKASMAGQLQMPQCLILNGVDRVPDSHWHLFVRVLDAIRVLRATDGSLPTILMTSSRPARGIGSTTRMEEALSSVRAKELSVLDALVGARLKPKVERASAGNIELARMLGRAVRYGFGFRAGSADENGNCYRLRLAALELPESLFPDPWRMRQRVARFLVGCLDVSERVGLAVLASLDARFEVGTLTERARALVADWEHDGTAALPSPIREVLLECDQAACDTVFLEVCTRLRLLEDEAQRRTPSDPQGPAVRPPGPVDAHHTDLPILINRLLRMNLADLPLVGPWGSLILHFVAPLDVRMAATDADSVAAGRLVARLVNPPRGQELAIPPLLLARLSSIYGRVGLDLATIAQGGSADDPAVMSAAALDRHRASAFLAQHWMTHGEAISALIWPWSVSRATNAQAYTVATWRMERIGAGGGRARIIAAIRAKHNSVQGTVVVRARPTELLWRTGTTHERCKLRSGEDVWKDLVKDVLAAVVGKEHPKLDPKESALILRSCAYECMIAAVHGREPIPATVLNTDVHWSLVESWLNRCADLEDEFARVECLNGPHEYAERARAEGAYLAVALQAPPSDSSAVPCSRAPNSEPVLPRQANT